MKLWIALVVALLTGCAGSNPREARMLGDSLACVFSPESCGYGSSQRTAPSANRIPTGELFLYGGNGHSTFLGCLTCESYRYNSVRHQNGPHGSPRAPASIRNPNSMFGSRYSDTSACNKLAGDPPIVVDRSGNYYGRLTTNPYSDPVKMPNVLSWLRGVCGQ